MTTVRIEALGGRGEGIATHDGRRVFVPFTLPGEMVEIALDGPCGTPVSLRDASPERIEAVCPYFGACGGCLLQHAGPALYAGFKRDLVVTALRHAGIDAPVAPLVDARGAGRRRATFHTDGKAAGYMRWRSHELLPIDACPILVPALRHRAPAIVRAIGAVAGPADVLVTTTDTGIDVAVRAARGLRPEALVPLARGLELARLALGGEVLYQ
ncbi:MAG TPA: RNA methyltransferase, partial [Alphaproteobacteria bacterium]|nr:RNA methyltransferase [Alphaproteobacteria bacterium]